MVNKYIRKGSVKLPLAVRIAAPFVFVAYMFSPGVVVGWNYESIEKQERITRDYERRIKVVERERADWERGLVDRMVRGRFENEDISEVVGGCDGN